MTCACAGVVVVPPTSGSVCRSSRFRSSSCKRTADRRCVPVAFRTNAGTAMTHQACCSRSPPACRRDRRVEDPGACRLASSRGYTAHSRRDRTRSGRCASSADSVYSTGPCTPARVSSHRKPSSHVRTTCRAIWRPGCRVQTWRPPSAGRRVRARRKLRPTAVSGKAGLTPLKEGVQTSASPGNRRTRAAGRYMT